MKRFQRYSDQKSFMVGGWVVGDIAIIESHRVHIELTRTQPGPNLDLSLTIMLHITQLLIRKKLFYYACVLLSKILSKLSPLVFFFSKLDHEQQSYGVSQLLGGYGVVQTKAMKFHNFFVVNNSFPEGISVLKSDTNLTPSSVKSEDIVKEPNTK